jgi:hypothetical protein
VAPSHTTKATAKEGTGENYTDAAYATAGSAVYSQHARSNFYIPRLPADEIKRIFSRDVVTLEDAQRQRVARLAHPRLSHGEELEYVYLLMDKGTLRRVKPLERAKSTAERVATDGVLILQAAKRTTLGSPPVNVTRESLWLDQTLRANGMTRADMRALFDVLVKNDYLQSNGKATSSLDHVITDKGRALLAESTKDTP